MARPDYGTYTGPVGTAGHPVPPPTGAGNNPNPPPAPEPPAPAAPTPAPTGGAAPTAPPAHFHLPPGAKLYLVNGVIQAVFDVGDGVKVYYDFSAPGTLNQVDLSGYPPVQPMDPHAFYGQPGLVHAGMVQELNQPAMQSISSYQDWFNQQLSYISKNAAWVTDPQMRAVYAESLTNPAMGPDELQAKIQQTTWWQTHTTAYNTFTSAPPAEQQYQISNSVAQLKDLYSKWGVPAPSDQSLNDMATKLAEQTMSEADITNNVRSQALVLYPWMKNQDPATDTLTASSPWRSTFTRVLELPDPGLFDPTIQKALTNGTPPYQFEQELRSDPRWQNTNNFASTVSSIGDQFARQMGFQK